jgi:CBS domain-containing protein
MKVKDLMTAEPGYVRASETLTKAADIMWQRDCGAVPVVDAEMQVTGMITDRDICRAVTRRNKKPSEIKAGEIASGEVIICRPEDKITAALKKMKKNQLRRLPVLDRDKKLAGIISIRDIIFASEKKKALRKRAYSALLQLAKPSAIVLHEISE